MENNTDWYFIENIAETDTPALVVYPNRVRENIRLAIEMIGDVARLRPHVKTNKMAEVCAMMLRAGISKFKCATIAEAEMLAMVGAKDVLLAYQPVGPKIARLISLIQQYPATTFSCLADNEQTATEMAEAASRNSIVLQVYIDVNVGMNRTGIEPKNVLQLIAFIKAKSSLAIAGLHVYDGHIRDSDLTLRQQNSNKAFNEIEALRGQASQLLGHDLIIIAGGTPTFPAHVNRQHTECTPGTFIFSDWGYKNMLPDEPFIYAALVVCRVISVIDDTTICVDLGHKSVAAENPLPRVHFLNAPDAVPVSQSEEHLVLNVPESNKYTCGSVLYGVPVHICPTVALYDVAHVVTEHQITNTWKVVARSRQLTV